jgi:hypothetical protein
MHREPFDIRDWQRKPARCSKPPRVAHIGEGRHAWARSAVEFGFGRSYSEAQFTERFAREQSRDE